MNHTNELIKIIRLLSVRPNSAANLYSEYGKLWRQLNLNSTQVSLWLSSLNLTNVQHEKQAGYKVPLDISAHLISLLQQAGGRMPLALVLKKLPAGITTSEQQIRKLAQQHTQLDIKGPLLILLN